MTLKRRITLVALVVSIMASIVSGSLAFWLQQKIAVTEAKANSVANALNDAVRNWQEAQHRIDLAVLHEDIAKFGNPSEIARQQTSHTVDLEIGTAWFYKQLATASDTNFTEAQQKLFSLAAEDAKRLNSINPVLQYFDTLFTTFKHRLDFLETQQAELQKATSRLRFLQLLVTQLAVALQVAALILAFYKLEHQDEKRKA